MNRKGQMAMLGIMLAMMVFITAVILIDPIKEQVTFARNSDNLDCGNASISSGNQLACILTDWQLPIFIGTCFAVGLGYIGLRQLRQGGA